MVKKSQIKESSQSVATLDPEMRALGMIETRGLVACIEAADAMVKAARVTFLGRQKVKGGLVAVMVAGDVGAGDRGGHGCRFCRSCDGCHRG